MTNEILDSLYCKCGGTYEHIDTHNNGDGTYDDSYRCHTCEVWCITTWDKENDQETGRRYEER